MNLEQLAGSVRKAAGLSLERADREDLDAIFGLHEGRLSIAAGRAEGGTIWIAADGTAEIIVCRTLSGHARRELIWHELGHFLLVEAGMSLPYPAQNGGNHRRLLGIWDECEEARCRRLVRALRMPLDLVLECQEDAEVAELSGCSLEEVRERRQDLLGR